MKNTIPLLAMAFLAGVTQAANAHDPDPYHDGWVGHVNDHELEICYKTEPPSIGQTVQILRTSYITVNKTVARQQFRPTGLARIAATTSSECRIAELVAGSASRTDHARAAIAKPSPK